MNLGLMILGIVIAVILFGAGITMLVRKQSKLYALAAFCFAIVIVLALLILNDTNGDGPNALVNPTQNPTLSVTNVPSGETQAPQETATAVPSGENEIPATATTAPSSDVPTVTTEPTSDATPMNVPATSTPSTDIEADWNGSTIYLTFDDGPSNEVTPTILDTLKKYNIKATFFVVNFQESEIPLLERMLSEGHTIGIHSYTHEYHEIYASTDAFWNDFNMLSDKLYEKIGYRPEIMRFPGGSSNSVSKKYCAGIMTALTKQMLDKGYQYFDWNIDTKDAEGEGKTAQQIADAAIAGLRTTRKENIVLMHDLEVKLTTGEAVEQIIVEGLKLGYRFDKITASTPPCHHGVNN